MATGKSKFVYVTYIRARPEAVFNALIDGEFTRQYWEHDNVSDWKPGSGWQHRRSDGSQAVDLVGEVIESVPPRRLVITWASPADVANSAKRSRVTFEVETVDEMTCLTVTHDELEPGSDMEKGITWGWPRVLSSLKSLLETGRPLPTWSKAKG